ncbi:hypothetical protein MSG28_015933 [Choristoneura fumiferana]|uniref:Uncharacterized protein n=1 Tax=Choristoneura fumiferana TaxID=7141 RepID=A0ACC0K4M9_CHOFU|nr:hypothetical protein MSG28_015933 [Choristoneura fumiferana]
MDEPPDIGGSPPEVAYNITIENKFSKLDESSMDTDVDQRSDRKRARPNKICKHCNKRKKRYDPTRRTKPRETDCSCQLPEITSIDTELSNAKSLDGFPSIVIRSYRKTTFAKPSSPRPKRLGYNKREHFNLIKDYDAPPPSNGVALNEAPPHRVALLDLSDDVLLLIMMNLSPRDLKALGL